MSGVFTYFSDAVEAYRIGKKSIDARKELRDKKPERDAKMAAFRAELERVPYRGRLAPIFDAAKIKAGSNHFDKAALAALLDDYPVSEDVYVYLGDVLIDQYELYLPRRGDVT